MNNTSDTPVYQIEQVAKSYGTRRVLEVERMSIYRREILALVGPSGAGKSTLLRLLNFLEPPTQGTIRFHDTIFSVGRDVPLDQRRRVTMVFQRPMLLNRTIASNVKFGLELRGERDSKEKVMAALEEVGLAHLANQKAHTLSGGEAQRAALARAIVMRPEVLLLDEPTANLDPYNVGLIEKIVLNLNKQHGTTLVLVTHNVFQAKRLAQRAAFLLDGKVIEVSDADTFFHEPRDPRTGAFVRGEMVY